MSVWFILNLFTYICLFHRLYKQSLYRSENISWTHALRWDIDTWHCSSAVILVQRTCAPSLKHSGTTTKWPTCSRFKSALFLCCNSGAGDFCFKGQAVRRRAQRSHDSWSDGRLRFDSWQRRFIISLGHHVQNDSGAPQSPVKWTTWALCRKKRGPELEPGHSPQYTVVLSYQSALPIRLHGVARGRREEKGYG
jgi:hypothetical protein